MQSMPGTHVGLHEIVKQLGRGGMAAAHRAHRPSMDSHMPFKLLPAPSQPNPTAGTESIWCVIPSLIRPGLSSLCRVTRGETTLAVEPNRLE